MIAIKIIEHMSIQGGGLMQARMALTACSKSKSAASISERYMAFFLYT